MSNIKKSLVDSLGLAHNKRAPPTVEKLSRPTWGVWMSTPESHSPLDSEEQLRARLAYCEERLNEIADLVARVRHEINNPLTGVLGQAQLLLREDLSEKARKRAQTIEELSMRLRDIVAQLRQVQRSTDNGERNSATRSN